MNASPQDSFFDRVFTGHPRSFWIFTMILVILNICWDYYHPLGVLFDVILLSALFRSYLKSRYRAEQQGNSR
jgi:hypothetical protein